jgi:N-acetylneuraminic acid mutarotase
MLRIIRYIFLLPVLLFAFCNSLEAQTGHWQILKTNNEIAERNECGLATVNGKLYLIGGDGGSPKKVECFDPKTLSWTTLASAPVVMHHFQAVALGKNIYVLAAFADGNYPNQNPLPGVYIYDTEKDNWKKGAEIAADRKRAGAGAAAYNGKLYLVAGIQHGHSSGTTNMFDEYDPQTNTWTVLPDAPHIRDHASATVIKDKLYAVGGRNTSYHEPDNFMAFFSHTVTEVDCFDFATGKWSTLSAKLPLGTGGGAVVNFKDKLYYMGGERATATSGNGPQKNVYFLDPATNNQWAEVDNLNKARNGTAAVVLNNTIYLLGGSGGGPGGPPPGNNPNRPFPGNNNPPDSANRNGFPPGPPPNGPNGGGNSSKIVIEILK